MAVLLFITLHKGPYMIDDLLLPDIPPQYVWLFPLQFLHGGNLKGLLQVFQVAPSEGWGFLAFIWADGVTLHSAFSQSGSPARNLRYI